MGKIDTILWDFDGTMINTREGILNSWKRVFKILRNIDVYDGSPELEGVWGEPMVKSLSRLFPEVSTDESLVIYRSYQKEHEDEMMKPFPEIVETIKKLHQEGYKLGVATSRLSPSTIQGLKDFHIYDCFGAIITADICEKHKPLPDPILMAMDKLGSKAENTAMVGDTMYDMMSAKAAGVTAILVGWSVDIINPKDAGEYEPKYTIATPKDIFDIL